MIWVGVILYIVFLVLCVAIFVGEVRGEGEEFYRD